MDSENKISVTTTDINKPFRFEGCTLNVGSKRSYDYYSTFDTAKELWDALQKKYDTEEAGTKKYVVSRYLKFSMIDEKSVISQAHDLQKIAHEILTEGMSICEQFQVAILIDKLPPSWKDFKKDLRHKSKDFLMENLIVRLRIEEEARKQDQKDKDLFVANKKNHSSAVLKPKGGITKPNQNQNRNGKPNQNKKLMEDDILREDGRIIAEQPKAPAKKVEKPEPKTYRDRKEYGQNKKESYKEKTEKCEKP
ncbi:uncharacterized protein LOC131303090 [Rhododendron vialii]|uniref:uncharacterized protein LOC131303090 n=1 Tax=Rhododendron vialii TaxID=182163 RepID=UPI00265D7475|nr:uncharacterized protein LOC131303090 [Rhododendron vialii]